MTIALEQKPDQQIDGFKLRPRPELGLGAALIGEEEETLVLEVLRRKELFRYYGPDPLHQPTMAATLEEELCRRVGRRYALAVSSGTAALEVALGALGVGPGDEVVLTAWSWISCFSSVVRAGARPVLAEIDENFSIAAGEINRLSTDRTKAVIIVHYQGAATDMDVVLAEADAAGIAVLEDCAQSPGATFHGRPVGSMGQIATFSFQYNKSITSGEGGAVVMDNSLLYERAVRMSDLSLMRPYHAEIVEPTASAFCGGNYRMAELQAAVALAQLRKLGKLAEHCHSLHRRVVERIADLPGLTLRPVPDAAGDQGIEVYFSVDTVELAQELRTRLHALNVNSQQITGTYCHYARPYCQNGLAQYGIAEPFAEFSEWPAKGYRAVDFPRTENLIHRFVALPIGAKYTIEDADYIGAAVQRVHAELLG